jgi:hypothetical protein
MKACNLKDECSLGKYCKCENVHKLQGEDKRKFCLDMLCEVYIIKKEDEVKI